MTDSTHIIKLDNILEKGASKYVLKLLMTAMLRNRRVFLDMGGKVYHLHCGGIESQCGGRRLQLMEYTTALHGSPIVHIPADVATRDDLMLGTPFNDFPEEGISLMAVELRDRDDLAKWVVFLDAMFEAWASDGIAYTHDWCVTGDRADGMLLFVAHFENEWEHTTEPPECEADFECQMCGSTVDEYGWCKECEETSHDPYDVSDDDDYCYASEDRDLTGCRVEDYENSCVAYATLMNGSVYAPTYIEHGFGICYYTQRANVGSQEMHFAYEFGPSRYSSTVGWGVESMCSALVYALCPHLLSYGHTFISCNVGDPGADTLGSMIELYENKDELKNWGLAIVQPEGYATNPNERHHYIDSMLLVVEDSVKLSMFKDEWGAYINQRLEEETCEHAA